MISDRESTVGIVLVSLLTLLTGAGIAGSLVWGPRAGLADLYFRQQSLAAGLVVGVAAGLLSLRTLETALGRITLVHLVGSAVVGAGLGLVLGAAVGLGKGVPVAGPALLFAGAVVGAVGTYLLGDSAVVPGVTVVVLGVTYCYSFVLLFGVLGPYPTNTTGIGLVFSTVWFAVVLRAGRQEVNEAVSAA
jgi:hypothetical protein